MTARAARNGFLMLAVRCRVPRDFRSSPPFGRAAPPIRLQEGQDHDAST
jgi:hypothetical protein